MSTTIQGDDTNFASTVELPSDGDKRKAVSVNVGLTNLADRTAFLSVDKATKLALARAMASTWRRGTEDTGVSVTPEFLVGGLNNVTGSNWWIVVGPATGSRPLLMHTSDGQILTDATGTFANFQLNQAAYDSVNDKWLAVGRKDGVDAYIVNTGAGPTQTWVTRPNPKNFDLECCGSAGGTSIAAGEHDGSNLYAVRSTDGGDTWAEVSIPGAAGDHVYGVVKGTGTTWVACGETSANAPLQWRSTDDGLTWSSLATPGLASLRAITYNGSVFVTVGDDGEILTITDGGTVALQRQPGSSPDDANIGSVASDPATGLLLAFALDSGAVQYLLVSEDDGLTWTRIGHTPLAEPNFSGVPTLNQFGGAWLINRTTGTGIISAISAALL